MFEWTRKKGVREGLFSLFMKDRAASFAIMTALLLPVFLLFFGLLFEGGRALAYYSQSKRVIAQACERSTKPTRTNVPLDDVRRKNVLDTFDAMIRSTKQDVVSRDVKIDWLTTDIEAKFSYKTVFGKMFQTEKLDYRLSYRCGGIPPYPHDGEVIVNNTFEKSLNGTERILKNGKGAKTPNGCWGVYTYAELGWDGGTGPGIELQDWSNADCRKNHGWQGYGEQEQEKPTTAGIACTSEPQIATPKEKTDTTVAGKEQPNDKDASKSEEKASTAGSKPSKREEKASQPPEAQQCDKEEENSDKTSFVSKNERIPPTRYAVELDSHWEGQKRRDANSSIFKYVEMHPGKYEISVWYNGRNRDYEGSNDIEISLQVLRPQTGPAKKIIQMSQKADEIRWERRSYKVTVDTYSLYKLSIAAAGTSDSLGGIITAFEVTYLDSL
ncbi:pilus assembly protein [Agrobacterium tumefaciens]|uniref:pilus assembly protein n=2 Tax=Rhizobium/Agrobacterium group TaxID=227290 RepID=UPI0021CEE3DF|nr:pilus assembly protein [Agrobacterium tumefaciens]UXT22384.1 pilus assembly protein [Agrobacterium tumefaciens]